MEGIIMDNLVSALASEIMAVSVYRMSKGDGESKDMVLKAIADVMTQNALSQREFGITVEEVKEAYSKRMDEMFEIMKEKKDDA